MTDKPVEWCLLALAPCLPSSEWSAWIQAIGSIAAIFAAGWIAVCQSKTQHSNAVLLHQREQISAHLDLAKTLFVLATNSCSVMQYAANQLGSRDTVRKAAEGLIPLDIGELQRINGYLNAIPIHAVPHSLVSPIMSIGSTVRQFHEKVDMVFRLHQNMDAAMYQEFFRTLSEMNQSAAVVCKCIELEVERIGVALK